VKAGDRDQPVPGLIAVWTGRRVTLMPIEIDRRSVTIGRGDDADITIDDRRMSRKHAEIARVGGHWRVRDLDSHNGTFVDGSPITSIEQAELRVVRAGDTLLVVRADVRPFLGAGVALGEAIVGPTLQVAYDEIDAAARAGTIVHLVGETGSGKELAARRFHAAGPRASGPFIAVNCATVPAQLAEGLLFGVRKGAYSGADADRDGYFVAADGGTLFLDEIGELPLDVQAKLLRVLETHQVMALGATKPRTVDIRVCSATHRDLRAAVTEGSFREDLYYRLGRPVVALPPLRDRPEDIPYLAIAAVAKVSTRLALHPSLVEQLLLRPWPGNARELLAEIADAAGRAMAAQAELVTAEHLDALAGTALDGSVARRVSEIDAAAVEAALAKTNGNVTAAARELGIHRNQLRRFLAKR